MNRLEVAGTTFNRINALVSADVQTGYSWQKTGTNATQWEAYVPAGSTDLRINNGGDRVTFQTGGNVGVGTAAPLSKLGVLGNLSVGATYGAIAAPTSGLIVEGNVGIGTTAPGQKLDVNGQSRFRDSLNFGATDDQGLLSWTSDIGGGQASMIFGGNSGKGLFLRANGSNSTGAFINTSGNVGIGTTAPGAKLAISGNTEVYGTIRAGLNIAASANGGQFISASSQYSGRGGAQLVTAHICRWRRLYRECLRSASVVIILFRTATKPSIQLLYIIRMNMLMVTEILKTSG